MEAYLRLCVVISRAVAGDSTDKHRDRARVLVLWARVRLCRRTRAGQVRARAIDRRTRECASRDDFGRDDDGARDGDDDGDDDVDVGVFRARAASRRSRDGWRDGASARERSRGGDDARGVVRARARGRGGWGERDGCGEYVVGEYVVVVVVVDDVDEENEGKRCAGLLVSSGVRARRAG